MRKLWRKFWFQIKLLGNTGGGGGTKGSSTTSIYNPTPAPAPTTAQSMQDWVANNPAVLAEQLRAAPLEAKAYMDLYNQYALPIAQADYQANAALYPETAKLQETMAGQSAEGMTATQMPDWMRKQYQSDMNANLGTNAGSPIGADYVSRGMQEQLFNQQKYYQGLGTSLVGAQPLTQATSPQTTNYASTFTPSNLMSFMNQKPVGSTSTTTSGGGGGLFGLF